MSDKSRCKACSGGNLCPHGRRRSICHQCGGKDTCQHAKQRRYCGACKSLLVVGAVVEITGDNGETAVGRITHIRERNEGSHRSNINKVVRIDLSDGASSSFELWKTRFRFVEGERTTTEEVEVESVLVRQPFDLGLRLAVKWVRDDGTHAYYAGTVVGRKEPAHAADGALVDAVIDLEYDGDAGDPRYDAGDPWYDGGDPRYDAGDRRYDASDPRYDAGDPRYDGGDPRYDAGDRRYDGGNPRWYDGGGGRTRESHRLSEIEYRILPDVREVSCIEGDVTEVESDDDVGGSYEDAGGGYVGGSYEDVGSSQETQAAPGDTDCSHDDADPSHDVAGSSRGTLRLGEHLWAPGPDGGMTEALVIARRRRSAKLRFLDWGREYDIWLPVDVLSQ